jgi:transcriptional regulator of acetoin/glycerol metabolism
VPRADVALDETLSAERARELMRAATGTDEDREAIVVALEKCGGNQSHAAKLLGISRGTLIKRIHDYNLPRPRKRD